MKLSRVFVFVGLALLLGCNQSTGPETVEVSGTVTMQGDPVDGATIVFSRTNAGEASQLASQAETDADGNFSLGTYLGGDNFKSGIEPGDYQVSISKLEVVQDMRKRPKNLLPKKYSEPSTSGLTATVKVDGENNFVFDL